jgi:hypothetical protein
MTEKTSNYYQNDNALIETIAVTLDNSTSIKISEFHSDELRVQRVNYIIGQSHSGKYTLLKYLLNFCFEMEEMFVFTDNTTKFEELTLKSRIFNQNDCKQLSVLYQNFLLQNQKIKRVLILDQSSVTDFFDKNKTILERFIMNCRHLNLTIFILSQDHLQLSPIIRSNIKNIFVFNFRSSLKKKLFDQFIHSLTYEQFCQIFETITSQSHRCLFFSNKYLNNREGMNFQWLKAPNGLNLKDLIKQNY